MENEDFNNYYFVPRNWQPLISGKKTHLTKSGVFSLILKGNIYVSQNNGRKQWGKRLSGSVAFTLTCTYLRPARGNG